MSEPNKTESDKDGAFLEKPDSLRHYSRREVITKVAATSAASVAGVGVGAWLLTRDPPGPPELHEIRDHRSERIPGAVDMAIIRGVDPTTITRKAIAALGGMSRFVKPGDKVVVKPNVGWNRMPQQAANTNPEVVAEVVRQVVAAGASEVWVCDGPVNNAERCFARSGISDAARAAGGEIVLPSPSAYRQVLVGGSMLRTAKVLWPIVEADRVINVPIVKQHSLTGATMAMKNWYGVLGGHRARLHQRIDESIVDLTRMVKPTLTVMDATSVLMANGPSGGSVGDVKRFDTVAAGIDEVALDAFGAGFLGRAPMSLGFLALAQKAGLGVADYRSLKLVEETG